LLTREQNDVCLKRAAELRGLSTFKKKNVPASGWLAMNKDRKDFIFNGPLGFIAIELQFLMNMIYL
jgi:hypothetical protein